MTLNEVLAIATFLAIGLVWLYVNRKSGTNWLSRMSLYIMVGMLLTASVLAILALVR